MNSTTEKSLNPKLIFISYARVDAPIAKTLGEEIERTFRGQIKVFTAAAEGALPPASQWRVILHSALRDARLLLVILTKNSLSRSWIYWECGAAFLNHTPIVPLLGAGLCMSDLPDQFRELQAVQLCDRKQVVAQLMQRLADMAKTPCNSEGVRRLHQRMKRIRLPGGKEWARTTDGSLRQALESATSTLNIRLLSYTSETTARTVGEIIQAYGRPDQRIIVQVLIRSDLDPFPGRSNAIEYNHHIRMRISAAVAEWYRTVKNHNVDVRVRHYKHDPDLRMMIVGREAFFGFYAVRLNRLSGRDDLVARDWVATDTVMAPIDSSHQLLVDNLASRFDEVWSAASPRSNEQYRCERSETLWTLASEMKSRDPGVSEMLAKWTYRDRSGAQRREIGNFALPATLPEEEGCSSISLDAS